MTCVTLVHLPCNLDGQCPAERALLNGSAQVPCSKALLNCPAVPEHDAGTLAAWLPWIGQLGGCMQVLQAGQAWIGRGSAAQGRWK